MIFSKKKRSPGIILIFTLFSLALLSMIFVYCLEDRGPREKFYSLALKAGGFLDVKKNGNTLKVDVRGLLDLERWSMLNYLSACFYNLATDPKTYRWCIEGNKNFNELALYTFFLYKTGHNFFSRNEDTYKSPGDRYFIVRALNMIGFKEIEDLVNNWFVRLLPIEYSDSVKKVLTDKKDALNGHIKLHHVDGKEEHVKGIMKDQGIVHNSHLKVEAKINLADNKLPFNEKFKEEALDALYKCIETAYPANKNRTLQWGKTKGKNKPSDSNFGAETIVNKARELIDSYNEKCPGYTLTFSDLMSISELRLLIQGNFEDDTFDEYEWARNAFERKIREDEKFIKIGEKNGKKLEALIRDTFVFHDIYAVNFLLANKFVQDAFIKVNIPTRFSPIDFLHRYSYLDHRFRYVGRRRWIETNTAGKPEVTDTVTSMYFFDEINSLEEEKLADFLGQEFFVNKKDKPPFHKQIYKFLRYEKRFNDLTDNRLEKIYEEIFKTDVPAGIDRAGTIEKIKEGTKGIIRKLLRDILKARLDLYYDVDGCGDARKVILATISGLNLYRELTNDERQFSEAFDYLGLECKTDRLFSVKGKEVKLVRGREKNSINGIINMAIDEDEGIMNLQILKILCKKLSVFCAKDEKDQKLYLFPYPWDDNLKNHDVGSICDVSDNGIEHISYHYNYKGDEGGAKLDGILEYSLDFKFNEKVGIMEPDYTKYKHISDTYKNNLLLKEDVFTDKELGLKVRSGHSGNPWDRVRNFCSFSNYANVKLRIYDDKLPFIRKETDDVIYFDVPNDLKLALFKEKSGGKYERGGDGSIKFIPKGGFHIEPMLKQDYDNP